MRPDTMDTTEVLAEVLASGLEDVAMFGIYDPDAVAEFRIEATEAGFLKDAVSHASYLINLCATNPETLQTFRGMLLDLVPGGLDLTRSPGQGTGRQSASASGSIS